MREGAATEAERPRPGQNRHPRILQVVNISRDWGRRELALRHFAGRRDVTYVSNGDLADKSPRMMDADKPAAPPVLMVAKRQKRLRRQRTDRGDAPRALRVAFVSDSVHPYNKGGKEKRLYELTTRLAQDEGFEVHIYTMQWWPGPRTVHRDGVSFHAISHLHPLYESHRRSTRQALLFGLATLRLIFERFDVLDVDHMPFFPLFSARIVCFFRRRPLVGTWHEVWGRDYWSHYMGRSGRVGHLIETIALHLPDLIVSNSAHTTARLARILPAARVVTVSLGVDVEHIATIAASPRESDVIFAGRLLSHKNVSLLLDAIALIRTARPNIRCLIVGEGPERAGLERKAAELNLCDNIAFMDFLPSHDELVSVLKASKVFALPSEREGFGLVVLEANASGLPVITVRHPNNAAGDLVIDGRNGCVVDLNAQSLADGIMRAFEQPGWLSALSPAPDWLLDFDWSRVAAQLGSLLTTIGRGER